MRNTIKIGSLMVCMIIVSMMSGRAQTVCQCALPIDGTFQIAPMTLGQGTDVGVPPLYESNNATTPAMALPFSFCFYGQTYDSVYISNNGIISFIKPIFAFIDSTQAIPLGTDTAIIAPFFADASTLGNTGIVYYKITPTYMVVIWDSLRYAGIDVDGWNTFQLIITNGTDPILPNGNNVSYCYPIMQWDCSDSSGGFSGYGGTPAFIGTNKGDGHTYSQLGAFALPNSDYFGPFSPYNGVGWLDFQYFYFSTCVTRNVIAPYICNNIPSTNTYYICPCDTSSTLAALGAPDSFLVQPCDTVNFLATFLCAEPGQTAILTYSVTGPLNITSVYTNTAGIFDTIIVQAIPAFGDTGFHTLGLTAIDTVNHVGSTVTYTIDVTTDCANLPPPHIATGVALLPGKNDFSVYPNPAGRNLVISYDKGLGNTTVKMYEVTGTEVFSAGLSSDSTDIDVSGLARGMYFVELYKDGIPISVKKIILL